VRQIEQRVKRTERSRDVTHLELTGKARDLLNLVPDGRPSRELMARHHQDDGASE